VLHLRAFAALVLSLLPLVAQQPNCAGCHPEIAARLPESAHASLGCLGCHPKYVTVPHPPGLGLPQCADCHPTAEATYITGAHGIAVRAGNTAAPDCAACHGTAHELPFARSEKFRLSVPKMCGGCHPDVAKNYLESIHGTAFESGNFDAPFCSTCHGNHVQVPLANVGALGQPGLIRDTCASCHANLLLARRYQLPLTVVQSFNNTYHGLALKAGNLAVANCGSCHRVHLVLPSSDPRSSVNQANLPATCGKCHPGAGARFAIGTIHIVPGTAPVALKMVTVAYTFLIPLMLTYMAAHHLGDFIHKLKRLRLRTTPVGPFPAHLPELNAETRMHRFERIEHVVLLVSFTVLAWSGFALLYPNAWWAWPLVTWEPVYPVRGMVHRAAAAVLLTGGVMHAGSLLLDMNLRRHWWTLWPRRKDIPEFFLNTAYNLGLRKQKPLISSHSYIEKLEYWAVIWGTVVMAITGGMLWFNWYTLQVLPKTWLDVSVAIHLFEATLATLAIIIWHFYMVIFDPEVYPMDPAWIHGVSVRRRVRESPEEEDQTPPPGAEP